MIEAASLVKRFGTFTALDGLDARIEEGSVYGLVGPNGSGKSTLLRLACGVYQPDGGTISVDGAPIFENSAVKDRIFYLSDDLYFLPKTTVDEMAAFYQGLYSGFSREKYEYLKTLFPIQAKQKLSTFSKGMRRQAALMLALSCGTDYLLLDEAFDGLDPVIRLLVKKLMAEEIAQRNLTVVITSHNLRELEDLCDQIGLLHKGKILFQQELDTLKFGFCKVQAAYDHLVDWEASGLVILQRQERGSYVNLLVRGSSEETLQVLQRYGPLFCEAVPLTLEEVFIGEMEAVGYDYNNILS